MSSVIPSMPRSQKLCTCVRRSAQTVGVGSPRPSKTLIRPLFSATNTLPSGANLTTVGLVSPLNAVVSWNPAGTVPAEADPVTTRVATQARASAIPLRIIALRMVTSMSRFRFPRFRFPVPMSACDGSGPG
jgi:hypothetical protein